MTLLDALLFIAYMERVKLVAAGHELARPGYEFSCPAGLRLTRDSRAYWVHCSYITAGGELLDVSKALELPRSCSVEQARTHIIQSVLGFLVRCIPWDDYYANGDPTADTDQATSRVWHFHAPWYIAQVRETSGHPWSECYPDVQPVDNTGPSWAESIEHMFMFEAAKPLSERQFSGEIDIWRK